MRGDRLPLSSVESSVGQWWALVAGGGWCRSLTRTRIIPKIRQGRLIGSHHVTILLLDF